MPNVCDVDADVRSVLFDCSEYRLRMVDAACSYHMARQQEVCDPLFDGVLVPTVPTCKPAVLNGGLYE